MGASALTLDANALAHSEDMLGILARRGVGKHALWLDSVAGVILLDIERLAPTIDCPWQECIKFAEIVVNNDGEIVLSLNALIEPKQQETLRMAVTKERHVPCQTKQV